MNNIQLTNEECANIKIALAQTAKSPSVDEQGMIILLNLSQKFNVQLPARDETGQKSLRE